MRFGPNPPITIGGSGCCTGFGSAGESVERVVRAEVREPRADGGRPEAGDDLELLGQPLEALAGVGERDAVGRVLAVVPAGAEPELDPAVAHRVDLRDA